MDPLLVYHRRYDLFVRGTFFRAQKQSRLFGDHPVLQTVMRVSDPKLHTQYGREVR